MLNYEVKFYRLFARSFKIWKLDNQLLSEANLESFILKQIRDEI